MVYKFPPTAMKKASSLIPSTKEIVVTVDADGNADEGHQFTRIDENTFLIDGLEYYYDKYENEGLSVTGYDPDLFTGTAIIISKLIYNGRTMDVVGIEDFNKCRSLTSVTIPESVTSIGEFAFWGCSSLPSIIIPESVTSIGNNAFWGCRSLTSITIPKSVTRIGSYAFYGCSSLTSITIPADVTRIEDGAFSGCCSLTSITIPAGVTRIGNNAFWGCHRLTDFYCYAEMPPSIVSSNTFCGTTFYGTPISSVHVPAGSVDAYKAIYPWKIFKTIVAIE